MKKTGLVEKNLSRRAFVAALGLGGAAFVAGCSQGESDVVDEADSDMPIVEDDAAASDVAESDGVATGKTLVAYFSATGNTARVAEAAAAELGADLFEIVPAEPYTSDDLNYNDDQSRVCREHDDESLRDVALAQTTPDGWEGYDRVLLGYPIWWGIAGWPVNGFVSGNDFAGKTVVPFCTSASSGVGDSASLLAELANSGDWAEGVRFSSSVDDADVAAWAQGL